MKQKIIAQGAEAVITLSKNEITKNRIKKSYRHIKIDEMLRKRRTKAETKIIEKASKIIPVPTLLKSKDYKIRMSYIKGKKLSEHLEKTNYLKTCKQIGQNIALLHNIGIIHGDLTTSNMILSKNLPKANSINRTNAMSRSPISSKEKVYFIDFGLSFHSDRIEDKAVDLHLISQALEAKHPKIFQKSFKSVLQGYKSKSKNYQQVIKRLEKVEKRGRYKQQY